MSLSQHIGVLTLVTRRRVALSVQESLFWSEFSAVVSADAFGTTGLSLDTVVGHPDLVLATWLVLAVLDLLANWIGGESRSGAQEWDTGSRWLLRVTNSETHVRSERTRILGFAFISGFVGVLSAY